MTEQPIEPDAIRPCRGRRAQRRAISLVEMLIVVGIIGVLVALLLPAIQSVRESARRTKCQNNLKQIVQACHAFESAKGSLPSLYNGTSLVYPLDDYDMFHTHSWRVELLTQLEQQQLRDSIKWSSLATDPENASVAQAVVSVYICPSGADPRSTMGRGLYRSARSESPSTTNMYSVTRSDYDAITGIQVWPETLPPGSDLNSEQFIRWGMWGKPDLVAGKVGGGPLIAYRPGKFREVTDGLSNTIVAAERGGKPIDLLNGKPNVTESNPQANFRGQPGWSASSAIYWSMNQNDVGINQSNSTGIYSLHTGGAYVAIADGSVRFLSESTPVSELVQLISKAGGQD